MVLRHTRLVFGIGHVLGEATIGIFLGFEQELVIFTWLVFTIDVTWVGLVTCLWGEDDDVLTHTVLVVIQDGDDTGEFGFAEFSFHSSVWLRSPH